MQRRDRYKGGGQVSNANRLPVTGVNAVRQDAGHPSPPTSPRPTPRNAGEAWAAPLKLPPDSLPTVSEQPAGHRPRVNHYNQHRRRHLRRRKTEHTSARFLPPLFQACAQTWGSAPTERLELQHPGCTRSGASESPPIRKREGKERGREMQGNRPQRACVQMCLGCLGKDGGARIQFFADYIQVGEGPARS